MELMKASCSLVASVIAASTVAFSNSAYPGGDRDADASFSSSDQMRSSYVRRDCSSSSSEKEKFAPRFDGLRFIETLVTAHR